MKISYNWLKEYVDVDLPAVEVAEILTNTGLEVEGWEHTATVEGGLEGLVIGQVKEVWTHPNADKLKMTRVDVGDGEALQIVCGAPNVAEGQKVVVATVGTTIYPTEGEPFQIKKAKIRGEESFGMICAEDEIGLGESHEGIMVLDAEAPVGAPAKKYFKIEDDYLFEIGLTPNRSDAMGHVGVARDLVAALNVESKKTYVLTLPRVDDYKADNTDLQIAVEVKNNEACPRYSGITISNIKVEESPRWLQNKLLSVGIRPINNVVDATNFILKELGQPLHAFDAAAIKGNKVVVDTLPDGTEFITLDEKTRKLGGNDLMICNAEEGMCIAGVFGGAGSGVKGSTTAIFLESAYFNPTYIRRTMTKHDLRTDAATRYEKGADPEITVYALKRAAMLIRELTGGQVSSDIVDVYPQPVEPVKVKLRFEWMRKLVGMVIPKDTVKAILSDLDIEVTKEDDKSLQLSIPPYRADVTREADVIEEVARIYGYYKIPMPEKLNTAISYSDDTIDKEQVNNNIADYLSANGFYELFTNSITNSKYYEKLLPEHAKGLVRMMNATSAELDVLRASMLFSGLEAIAHNKNRGSHNLKFYDIGKTYSKKQDDYLEQSHLALFASGNIFEESWMDKEQKANFYYLKAFVHGILEKLGIAVSVADEYSDEVLEYGLEYRVNDKSLLRYGSVRQNILNWMDIKAEVLFADVDWDYALKLAGGRDITYAGIPKYPAIRRDLSMLLKKGVKFAAIEELARKAGGERLRAVNLFDVYKDESMGDDEHSYAVSFLFRDDERTLTDKEVDKVMDKLIGQYRKELNASIR